MTNTKGFKIDFSSSVGINPFESSVFGQNLVSEEIEGELLVDVFEDEKNIYVKTLIAGVEQKDFEISFFDNVLTLKGERKEHDLSANNKVLCKECFWGKFSRSISLPDEIKADKIKADLKDGLLKITLPKAQVKNFEIKINKN